MDNIEILKGAINDILRNIPHRPFLCLPLSAMLYAKLRDDHGLDAQLVTGDLSFEDEIIFKQDFSLTDAVDGYQTWAGHAWVQLNGAICDLSIFRTLYSDKFTKICKPKMVSQFGESRGCLVAPHAQMQAFGLHYSPVDVLSDDLATGIIKGIPHLLSQGT